MEDSAFVLRVSAPPNAVDRQALELLRRCGTKFQELVHVKTSPVVVAPHDVAVTPSWSCEGCVVKGPAVNAAMMRACLALNPSWTADEVSSCWYASEAPEPDNTPTTCCTNMKNE